MKLTVTNWISPGAILDIHCHKWGKVPHSEVANKTEENFFNLAVASSNKCRCRFTFWPLSVFFFWETTQISPFGRNRESNRINMSACPSSPWVQQVGTFQGFPKLIRWKSIIPTSVKRPELSCQCNPGSCCWTCCCCCCRLLWGCWESYDKISYIT